MRIESQTTSFSLLSLNTFGIPFFLSTGRIKRLARELNRLAPSILCLQEIQQNSYVPLLKQGLTAYSDHAFFCNRLAPKGGLFSASMPAHPIIKGEFFQFSNQGKPFSIGFSDWALNKGVLTVNLDVGGRPFVIMNTHLQANYLGDWRPTNRQTQIQLDQVGFLSALVTAQPQEACVIVCGDFNFPRHSPAYQAMIAQGALIDALANDPHPTYLPFPLVSTKWKTSLDYIFYRNPRGVSLSVGAEIFPITNSFAHNPFQRFLTDHCALRLNIS